MYICSASLPLMTGFPPPNKHTSSRFRRSIPCFSPDVGNTRGADVSGSPLERSRHGFSSGIRTACMYPVSGDRKETERKVTLYFARVGIVKSTAMTRNRWGSDLAGRSRFRISSSAVRKFHLADFTALPLVTLLVNRNSIVSQDSYSSRFCQVAIPYLPYTVELTIERPSPSRGTNSAVSRESLFIF